MTLQISKRGKEYLKTAQTLLRSAKTMTGDCGSAQGVADDYERRAEKASRDEQLALASCQPGTGVACVNRWVGSAQRLSADPRSELQPKVGRPRSTGAGCVGA